MEHFEQQDFDTQPESNNDKVIVLDPTKMDNEVLKRLIGEIDFENKNRIQSYNRTHNRHNRGR